MNSYDYLIDFLAKENENISDDFASFLNHYYGTIKEKNVIKQYVFVEGNNKNEVLDFLKEKWDLNLKNFNEKDL